MPAPPIAGDISKPENLFPIVDESDRVQHVNATFTVPADLFTHAVRIPEFSHLVSDIEIKWYAPGIGVVKGTAPDEDFGLVASTFAHAAK